MIQSWAMVKIFGRVIILSGILVSGSILADFTYKGYKINIRMTYFLLGNWAIVYQMSIWYHFYIIVAKALGGCWVVLHSRCSIGCVHNASTIRGFWRAIDEVANIMRWWVLGGLLMESSLCLCSNFFVELWRKLACDWVLLSLPPGSPSKSFEEIVLGL